MPTGVLIMAWGEHCEAQLYVSVCWKCWKVVHMDLTFAKVKVKRLYENCSVLLVERLY